ncbi:hypothetical protein [Rhizobium sp. RSm-3]|uniref:hypothetical protein n=1 Tax=Rhizobium sp. RSm-3 TaxID=1720346 RepID=UPI0011AB8D93|nr:hypothetical protein [Rhizobium sp. RSm-3]
MGIVSRHQLPKWMLSDFPAIYRTMKGSCLEDGNPDAMGVGLPDMDEEYAKGARAAMSDYMACMRAIKDNQKARTILTDAAAVVTEVSELVTGKRAWPRSCGHLSEP